MISSEVVVLEANEESQIGNQIGQCKWFNDKLGYGFITVQQGEDKGKDIFVHHSGIQPLNSNYKTLKKGEYIHFNVIQGDNGLQAVQVTGILGGPLMCDVSPAIKGTVPDFAIAGPPHPGHAGPVVHPPFVPYQRGFKPRTPFANTFPPPPPPPPPPRHLLVNKKESVKDPAKETKETKENKKEKEIKNE